MSLQTHPGRLPNHSFLEKVRRYWHYTRIQVVFSSLLDRDDWWQLLVYRCSPLFTYWSTAVPTRHHIEVIFEQHFEHFPKYQQLTFLFKLALSKALARICRLLGLCFLFHLFLICTYMDIFLNVLLYTVHTLSFFSDSPCIYGTKIKILILLSNCLYWAFSYWPNFVRFRNKRRKNSLSDTKSGCSLKFTNFSVTICVEMTNKIRISQCS